MTQQHIHQHQARRGRGFKYAFRRSTWITVVWNWFLMLAGKAAEPILTISVIYNCARLLPGIHLPVQLDNTVFICQMIALDVGGLSLRKLADQARKDGELAGATLAGRVSTALLTILGINVALSVLETIAPLDPTFTKVVEGILLIARAVMAVFYAYVIHSLHNDQGGGDEPHDDPPMQPDLWPLVGLAAWQQEQMARLQTSMEHRLVTLFTEQSRMQTEIDQAMQQISIPVPDSDRQALIQAVIDYLVPHFQAKFQAVDQELFRQKTMVSEVQNQAKRLPEFRQAQAKSLPEKATSSGKVQAADSGSALPEKKAFRQAVQADHSGIQAEQNILRLVPANATREQMIAEAKRLQSTGLSTYQIGEKLGKSPKTVQSWFSGKALSTDGGDLEAVNE